MAPVAQLTQLRLFDELGRAKEQKLLGPTPEDRRYHLNGPVEIGELLLKRPAVAPAEGLLAQAV